MVDYRDAIRETLELVEVVRCDKNRPIRPPQLTGKPLSGTYRTAFGQNLRGGLSVPRADVAHLMLKVLGQPDTIGHAIGIAS